MKKQNKLGFLALIGLVAVASIFTVCKASGAGTGTDERAVWKVTFDTADGEPVPEPVTVAHGETIGALPETDPEKDGFIFGGWRLDDARFDPTTPVTRDITLRAYWIGPVEENCFHVIFNGDGGVFPADYGSATHIEENLSEGSTVNPLPTVERNGYIFGGWWTEKNGSGEEFTESTEVSEDLAIEGVITIYAKWTALAEGPVGPEAVPDYTVTFDKNHSDDGGFTEADPAAIVVTDPATTVVNLPEPPTRAGYAFDGWNTQDNGLGDEFTASTTVGESITVWAQWTVNPEPVYDYLEHGNSCADLDGFIVDNYADANAVANPARVKIINAGGLGAQMASISGEVTAAGAYVSLDLSDPSNSFAGTMPDAIKKNAYVKGIALPVSVSNIEAGAFNYFTSLATVSLPAAQTIGDGAFLNCTSLATVDLPVAQTIGASAFQYCAALATVSLPAAQTIGDGAFSTCTSLATVSLPVAQTIGGGAFTTCAALATVELPEARTIGDWAFYKCALATVILPEAQTIGDSAFQYCTSLVTVDIPKAQTIVMYAFDNCAALASVALPANVDIENANAFPGNLKSTYDAGGSKLAGTYTRSPPSDAWAKQ